jgi:N6-L-threonylcarbamoyladenine synthase/protein kinase Bud32
MAEKILFRGAEADILLHKGKNLVFKDRNPRSYRLKELDEKIRKARTKSEMKILEKVAKAIPVPKVRPIRRDAINFRIAMDFVKGKMLSENLDKFTREKQGEIAKKIGENIAKMHRLDIVHGDLTTSNMIFNENEEKVYFIDFGLGFSSQKVEDKAVDLYLLKEAFESRHFKNWGFLFNRAKKGYGISKNSREVLNRLKKVGSRGRYKEKY